MKWSVVPAVTVYFLIVGIGVYSWVAHGGWRVSAFVHGALFVVPVVALMVYGISLAALTILFTSIDLVRSRVPRA